MGHPIYGKYSYGFITGYIDYSRSKIRDAKVGDGFTIAHFQIDWYMGDGPPETTWESFSSMLGPCSLGYLIAIESFYINVMRQKVTPPRPLSELPHPSDLAESTEPGEGGSILKILAAKWGNRSERATF